MRGVSKEGGKELMGEQNLLSWAFVTFELPESVQIDCKIGRTIVSTKEGLRILVFKGAIEVFLRLLHYDVHISVHARQNA